MYQRQADDPYWLHLSDAAQLVRELGINRPATVVDQVNALGPRSSAEFKERILRNFKRTWLIVFVADKGFGIVNGRTTSVAWNELPPCPCQWWRKPMTTPIDRMINGIIEMRVHLLEALKQLECTKKTVASILSWHSKAFEALERTRNIRCYPEGSSLEPRLPVLAFYTDHSLMVLNAQALRDLMSVDDTGTSNELSMLYQNAFDVVRRLLDLVLSNPVMQELKLGWHNNQFTMVAHAMTEILHAIKRDNLPSADVADATSKVRAIPRYMEDMAQELPATSAVHLYAALSRIFASQLEIIANAGAESQYQSTVGDPNGFSPDWLRAVDVGSLDPATWFDMGFLSVEQPSFGTGELGGIEGLSNLTFP